MMLTSPLMAFMGILSSHFSRASPLILPTNQSPTRVYNGLSRNVTFPDFLFNGSASVNAPWPPLPWYYNLPGALSDIDFHSYGPYLPPVLGAYLHEALEKLAEKVKRRSSAAEFITFIESVTGPGSIGITFVPN